MRDLCFSRIFFILLILVLKDSVFGVYVRQVCPAVQDSLLGTQMPPQSCPDVHLICHLPPSDPISAYSNLVSSMRFGSPC
ncbi:hypothetical protein F5H01DRAFT_334564 [Linnemannia elongata]|nr:hypothetical protein F5H01DRAFT_334564 [Linnemannia elongata]